jgi:hypothetical protein
MSKMSAKDVDKYLGQQYAKTLKESGSVTSIYRDCEEVIQGSLSLLERYNKVTMLIQNKRVAGMFS